MDLFLGIDLGASSLKACLINGAGAQQAIARVALETHHPQARHSEQNPQDWLTAMRTALAQLSDTHKLADIRAVSFSGGAHIGVLCDGAAAPLRPAIMWSDQRADMEAARLAEDGAVEKICGNRPNPTWSLPQLMWLSKHEPLIIDATKKFFFAKDWLRFQLTATHTSDATEAVGGMLADKNGQWSDALIALSGVHPNAFPPLAAPLDAIGTVTSEAAGLFGLPQNIPVYQGAIDTSTEWLCAAPQQADMASLKLASAGVLAFTTTKQHSFAPVSLYPHIIPSWHYHAAGMSDCMGAIEWLRQTMTPHLDAAQFVEAASHAPIGADGLLFYPYLSGARAPFWDASLSAALYGLTRAHDTTAIARAAFEGVGHVLTAIWHDMTARLDTKPALLHVLGGGAQTPFFCQMLADMLDTKLSVAPQGDCAYATALLAATANGAFADLSAAASAAYQPSHAFFPDKANSARYHNIHETFIARHR